MRRLKFALIGCGKIGVRHAAHIKHYAELVAVCDVDEEKAATLSKEYNAIAYTDLDTLLAKEPGVEVVSICTPNGLHAQHAIKALRAGKHVLCEKPMAISVSDCGEMIKEAERANKRLFAIKQNRFNPPVIAVKNAIDKGILGKIFSFQVSCFWNRNERYYQNSWKGTADMDGGTLFTQFSHFIDLIYYLVGDVNNAYALTRNFAHQSIIDFEDTGVAILELHNGAIGSLHYTVNSHQKNMEGSITLVAEKGTVKIGGQYLNELEYQNIEGFEIKDLPQGNKANNYGDYTGSMSNHDKVYENVADVLLRGEAISTNSFEAMKTIEIIEKIYRSAKKLNAG
ncbi:MAG: Gfo/Idh/MocA family oxidoreductase [Chitinophagaceae bacterium]|nr:Gfo/Idh/MocA family oxidoreductase [Chitinophagaceae bacterium]